MTQKTVDLPKFGRAAEVRSASFSEADNTIEVVWTTGAPVRRYSYREGVNYVETLEVSKEAVRLERLNAGAPFLNTHSDSNLSDVIGSVVPGSARIEGGKGVATIRLSSAAEDAGIVGKIRDGVIRNISVGYSIHKVERSVTSDGSDEEWLVVDWEPMEISAVPVPADAGSQIRSGGKTQPCQIVDRRSNAEVRESMIRRQRYSSIAGKLVRLERRIERFEEL